MGLPGACRVNERRTQSVVESNLVEALSSGDGVPGDERPRPQEPLVAGATQMPADGEEVGNDASCALSRACERIAPPRQARVENAFFRYKSIIGHGRRTRSPAGQRIEAVLACKILNQMTQRGRPVSYAIGR